MIPAMAKHDGCPVCRRVPAQRAGLLCPEHRRELLAPCDDLLAQWAQREVERTREQRAA